MVPHSHKAYVFSLMPIPGTDAFRDALAQRSTIEREIGREIVRCAFTERSIDEVKGLEPDGNCG